MNDDELEKLIFQGFIEGKTVNTIAKECEPLIQKIPDYKKRVQKVDNLKKKWKKQNNKEEEINQISPIKLEHEGKTFLLTPTHKPTKAENRGNVIEIDINLSSEAGRRLYAEVQANAKIRGEHRDFINGMITDKKEAIKDIFNSLLGSIDALTKAGVRGKALKEEITSFTTFLYSIKNPDWITSFAGETLAMGHVVASEIQGRNGGVLPVEVEENEIDGKGMLMDLSGTKFKGVI
jgi:hypothetical protein